MTAGWRVGADHQVVVENGAGREVDAIDIGMWVAGFGLLAVGAIRVLLRVFEKKRCTARAEGRVTSTEQDYNSGAAGEHETTTHFAKYEYWAEGKHVTGRERIPGRQYRRMTTGQRLTILYQPSNPKRHYVAEIKERWFITLLFIVGGVLFLIAAI